jgi:fructose-bisphosphate aldolase class II
MPLAQMNELLADARRRHVGVGAFNVVLLEHAEALVEAAERADSPVVLQISQNCVAYHGGLAPIGDAVLALGRAAEVGVVVHLDHADDPGLVQEALALGFQSIMFDASKLPYQENVRATTAVVDACHLARVSVEAELGEVGGKDGVHAAGARTDPQEALAFVEATGVDSLAVAVGSSHAKRERDLRVDRDLVAELRRTVGVPLVLHGSSSLDDDELVGAIRAGMTKINISTHLNGRFTEAVRAELDAEPAVIDPRAYIAAGRNAVGAEAERLLRLFGSTVAAIA